MIIPVYFTGKSLVISSTAAIYDNEIRNLSCKDLNYCINHNHILHCNLVFHFKKCIYEDMIL